MRIDGDVRLVQPRLVIAAWNVGRGTFVGDIARSLQRVNASVCLLSECDIGMARSGNRDTVKDIAERLGMGHAFAVEFQEHGLGNLAEQREFAGQENIDALHGNAILSDLPFERVLRIPLSDGEPWEDSEQPRTGGRVALAAEIGRTWFVSVHLENRTGPAKRARQANRLFTGLKKLKAKRIVIGGDLNVKLGRESLFDRAQTMNFRWKDANRDEGRFKGKRLDWFLVKGIKVKNPRTHDAAGISDHDLITLELT